MVASLLSLLPSVQNGSFPRGYIMSLLIKNGEVVTASERFVGDILCEG